MLKYLEIANFILIEQLKLSFMPGFTAISGETGAGKSIAIDALKCLLIKRLNKHPAKDSSKAVIISANFAIENSPQIKQILANNFIEAEDNQLILKRVIDQAGKSLAFINDQSCSVTLLNELALQLVEIHGQHDTNDLFSKAKQQELLDQLVADPQISKLTAQHFHNWQKTKKEIIEIRAQENSIQEEISYLSQIIDDLDRLEPSETDFTQLAAQKEQLKKQKDLSQTYQEIYQSFASESALQQEILQKQRLASSKYDKDPENFEQINEYLEQALINFDKICELIANQDSSAGNIEEIEEKISDYKTLSRKYQTTPEQLGDLLLESIRKKETLSKALDNLGDLTKQEIEQKQAYLKYAEQLHKLRLTAAKLLETSIAAHLDDLYMSQTLFQVAFKDLDETEYQAKAIKTPYFVAKTNPDMPFAELEKIASGGELSRFMLALKLSLNESFKTLIFDEIDTGISGKVSEAVGKKLKLLASERCIIVITHQPQVAAQAKHHLKVSKSYENNRTFITQHYLNPAEQLEEIARMISGSEITTAAKLAAKKLIA